VSRDQRNFEPLFDVHPVTGSSFEIFFADLTLESFGRCGAGWFWHSRWRGFAAEGPARGPFPTSYSAYRDAVANQTEGGLKVNTDIMRTRWEGLEASER
jgi:hypothetical protein